MTVGRGNFLSEIITLAGSDNLAGGADLAYPTYKP
jgi:hypothetical protein